METATDSEGNYNFGSMSEGNYWITAVATMNGVKYVLSRWTLFTIRTV
ncbi:MAG: hypothetical protein ACK5IQ_00565 [Bacteroidales bacterium]